MIGRRYKSPARIYWENYLGEKCGYNTFYSRITRYKMSYRKAIVPEFYLNKQRTKHDAFYKLRMHKSLISTSPLAVINITLSSAEASVFRAEYEKLLTQLEYDLQFCEDPADMLELDKKLTQLKEAIRCIRSITNILNQTFIFFTNHEPTRNSPQRSHSDGDETVWD